LHLPSAGSFGTNPVLQPGLRDGLGVVGSQICEGCCSKSTILTATGHAGKPAAAEKTQPTPLAPPVTGRAQIQADANPMRPKTARAAKRLGGWWKIGGLVIM